MTRPISYVFPRRLAESDDAIGKLVTAAIHSHPAGPTEEQSWNNLSVARTRPKYRGLLFLTAASVASLGLVFGLFSRDHSASRTQARAESFSASAKAPGAQLNAPSLPKQPTVPATKETPRLRNKADEKATTTDEATAPEKLSMVKPPEGARAQDNTQACASLARDGKVSEAVRCYDVIASGNSMAAELALYEKARLQIRALGELPQALQALGDHSRRFPGGVLHTEVEMTRIELLSRLGRTAEALQLIDSALSGALGRERGADLLAIRGDIYSSQHQCDLALADYSKAKRLGVHPSRVAAGEKRCESSNADLQLPEN